MEAKDTTKRVVFIAIGVLFLIGIFSLINYSSSSFERTYGNSINEQLKVLTSRLNALDKEVADLKSKISVLYVLVFISLVLAIGMSAFYASKVFKSKKKAFNKEESK